MNDLRYAIRQLLKNHGFTAVAVLTLALGIGANLALFANLNELLLRPKPVANPGELWAIEPADTAGQKLGVNVCRPYYEAIRRNARVFKGVLGYAQITPKLRTKEGSEVVVAELVSGNYFTFLGVAPILGRRAARAHRAGHAGSRVQPWAHSRFPAVRGRGDRSGAAHRVRQCRQPAPRSWTSTAEGNGHAPGARGDSDGAGASAKASCWPRSAPLVPRLPFPGLEASS